MLNVDDAQRRQAGTTLYECSFLSLSLYFIPLMPPSLTDEKE